MKRIDAQKLGLKKYFTGNPCPQGHICERYSSGGNCILCVQSRAKQWGNDHPEKKILSRAKWDFQNYLKKKIDHQTWLENNKDRVRIYNNNRRVKMKCGDSMIDIIQWEKEQKKICYWCGVKCKENYHVDHYIPLSKGGNNSINNLRISCAKCNHSKHAKDPYSFAASLGKLF